MVHWRLITVKDMRGKGGKRVIGIDASRANAEARTGVEWYAFHVIQELKQVVPDGYRVVLYSREPLRDGLEDLPAHWESRVLRWPWRLWTQLRLSWEMLRRPPDVLFIPAHTLPLVLPKRSVVTEHDVAFMPFPEAYSPHGRAYLVWATRHAVRNAARLLTVSEFSKSEIVRWFGADPEGIEVTPLGYDQALYRRPDDATLRETLRRYGIAGRYFLFVGRLETKKNIRGLFEAFRRYRELWPGEVASLVLIGKHGHGYAKEVADGVPDGVIEPGYVCQDDMPSLYAGAEALTFLSGYEGFGLPIIEAFACGTPVIASNSTSIPEVAGDAALLVDRRDPEECARAMHRIVADDAIREDLVESGRERAGRFSWRSTAERTWSALEEVSRNRPGED